jgi:hypothetical protein
MEAGGPSLNGQEPIAIRSFAAKTIVAEGMRERILACAENRKPVYGRSGINRLLLDSLSEALAHQAHGSVETV